jgi:hypothetical protein
MYVPAREYRAGFLASPPPTVGLPPVFPGGYVHSLAGTSIPWRACACLAEHCLEAWSAQAGWPPLLRSGTGVFRRKKEGPSKTCVFRRKLCPPGNVRARQGIQGRIFGQPTPNRRIAPCIPWRVCTFPSGYVHSMAGMRMPRGALPRVVVGTSRVAPSPEIRYERFPPEIRRTGATTPRPPPPRRRDSIACPIRSDPIRSDLQYAR